VSAATIWKGKPHALAFEARVRCGVAGEDVGGEKTEKGNPHALAFGARVRVGGQPVTYWEAQLINVGRASRRVMGFDVEIGFEHGTASSGLALLTCSSTQGRLLWISEVQAGTRFHHQHEAVFIWKEGTLYIQI
jgi:hypothetical protein